MEYQRYLDERVHQLKIVCEAQWDYLKYSNVCNWIDDNFPNDPEGKYYATKILLHTVYYKKKDLEELLKYGLYQKIYGEIVKQELIAEGNIHINNSEAAARVNKLRDATLFVPLLDANRPSESGNTVTGDLVHKCDIPQDQVVFHRDINAEKLADKKLLIVVDDCAGSWSQLNKFWNTREVKEIKADCDKLGIKIFYLVLVGYENKLSELIAKRKFEGIEIIMCDVLSNRNRVFSPENIIWTDNAERESAIQYFKKIEKEKGVRFEGFTKLDFAIILNDRLPNWSLPIFWKETTGWKYLLKRKTSK
jgi:hypothetical protein